ncbi:sugar phosphate isomerase/epimerase family protein [Pseudothermotoga sp.]|uniref:sugar phosphate isomerase/epimerase family protein n=1 Tax=Pseudothermotoga sp. TaxID=2033661 RepID=UPI0031F607BC
MKLAFNGATTIKAGLVEDVECAKKAGFELIEIWKSKLLDMLKKDGVETVKKLFEKHKLKPMTINSIEQITFFESEQEKLKECEQLCKLAKELGVEGIVLVPGFLKGFVDEKTIEDESIKMLKKMSNIANRFGVKLGFEFLGFPNCSVNKIELAWKIVQKVNEENVGIIVDTCHFFAGGSKLEQLEKIDPKKILIVHVNDLPKLKDVKDSDRVMPADGIVHLKDFFVTLRKIGYDGAVSVELFNEDYWNKPACETAKVAFEKLKAFM